MKIKFDFIGAVFVILGYLLVSIRVAPIGFAVMGVGCTAWLVYGYVARNAWIAVTNVFMLGMTLVALWNWW